MNTPPNLGAPRAPTPLPPPSVAVTAELLAHASTLTWQASVTRITQGPRDGMDVLGWLRDGVVRRNLCLVAGPSGSTSSTWALDGVGSIAVTVDPDCLRFLVSLETAHVLQEGTLDETTGALTWQGRRYRIEPTRDVTSTNLIARAVPW